MIIRILCLLLAIFLSTCGPSWARPVSIQQARSVARNWMMHCVQAYGSWANSTKPVITGEENVEFQGEVVAYNFLVFPAGHILVPAMDELPPVKLYSETSDFSVQSMENYEPAEWIAEELYKLKKKVREHAEDLAMVDHTKTRNGKMWAVFGSDTGFRNEYSKYTASKHALEALSIGPLLTTTWNQSSPYNSQCPYKSSGCRTIVGCVATAASQILRYWQYPAKGRGSTSYTWNGIQLSRDFSQSTYDWAHMPNALTSSSTQVQKDAVAKLCADVGISVHMNYGCSGSDAETYDVAEALSTYFGYNKSTIRKVARTTYDSDSDWMKVFMAEVQAGRPCQMKIRDPNAGGHSIVVDGYRDSPSEQIHLNMGWHGSYDGWYASNNMVTGGYSWSDVNYEGAVIGIEPANVVGVATLVSPTETIPTTRPAYRWKPVSNATKYCLNVTDTTGTRIQQWYTSTTAGCANGATDCRVTPATALASGTCSWKIKAANATLAGAWSNPESFTVSQIIKPGAVQTISPVGTIPTNKPAFIWKAVSNASNYNLKVINGTGTAVINRTYTAAAVGCSTGTGNCSVVSPVTLAEGSFSWRAQALNSAGAGPLSTSLAFKVSTHSAPAAARAISPSGTISTNKPSFTWTVVPNATRYQVKVSNSNGVVKIQKWYTSTQANCSSTTGACSVSPGIVLADGPNSWSVQTGNSFGPGGWSEVLPFTVNSITTPPGAATLISPTGTILTTRPTYTWKAVPGASQYLLWVTDSTDTKIFSWYTSAEAGCPNGTGNCSLNPPTALAAGAGSWLVGTRNEFGYGPQSNAMKFTVAANGGFNSQFNGSAAGWYYLTGAGIWSVSPNYYYTTGAAYKWTSTFYGSKSDISTNFSNFDFQARVRRTGDLNHSTGLMFRGIPSPVSGTENEWNRGYQFNIGNGQYSVWKHSPGIPSIDMVTWTSSPDIIPGDWNVLRIVANGSSLSFYINGKLQKQLTDTTFTSGKVGIFMYSQGSSGDKLEIDWATLTPVNATAAALPVFDSNAETAPFQLPAVLQKYDVIGN